MSCYNADNIWTAPCNVSHTIIVIDRLQNNPSQPAPYTNQDFNQAERNGSIEPTISVEIPI